MSFPAVNLVWGSNRAHDPRETEPFVSLNYLP